MAIPKCRTCGHYVKPGLEGEIRCMHNNQHSLAHCPMVRKPEKPEARGGCDHCDTCGGEKTYRNQAILPINGRTVCIDWCIHHIVAALNAANVRTIACCCGHGEQDGRIDLEDGRVLIIRSDPVNKTKSDDWVYTIGQHQTPKGNQDDNRNIKQAVSGIESAIARDQNS